MILQRIDSQSPEPEAIARAVEILRLGGTVAYPTDTLYGIAVDPRSDVAVRRLFDVKGRPPSMAVPLIAADHAQAEAAGTFGEVEHRLIEKFWPGPLTLVVRASPSIASRVLGGGVTVAIRVPAQAVARALAQGFGFCITATSANPSGSPATEDAAQVRAALGDRLDVLLDAGQTRGGAPSTIVRIDDGRPTLVRAGALAWERVLESLQ